MLKFKKRFYTDLIYEIFEQNKSETFQIFENISNINIESVN